MAKSPERRFKQPDFLAASPQISLRAGHWGRPGAEIDGLLSVVRSSAADEATFHITGELDGYTGSILTHAVLQGPLVRGTGLSLEMSGVTFIDSAGADALLAVSDSLRGGNVRMRLLNPPGCVERMVFMCDMGHEFRFDYDDPAQASTGGPAPLAPTT